MYYTVNLRLASHIAGPPVCVCDQYSQISSHAQLPQFLQAQSDDVAVIPLWAIWLVVAIVGIVLLVGLLVLVFLCGWYAKTLAPRRHRAQPPKIQNEFSLLKEQTDGPGIPSSYPTFSSLDTSMTTVAEGTHPTVLG